MITKGREVDHLQAMTGNTYEIVSCIMQKAAHGQSCKGRASMGQLGQPLDCVVKIHCLCSTFYHPLTSLAGDWFPLWCELMLQRDWPSHSPSNLPYWEAGLHSLGLLDPSLEGRLVSLGVEGLKNLKKVKSFQERGRGGVPKLNERCLAAHRYATFWLSAKEALIDG